jgi:SPP1 gp7 family putative phage head morphogenesis protein
LSIELKAVAPEDAIKSLALRGQQLSPSFAWQDAYGADHATMFTVARSAGFDILQDIQNGLSKALQEGRTFRDFSKELTPLLQAKGWWGKQLVTDPATGDKVAAQLGSTRRLQTIFDANMRVSYAAGHWANFQRNKVARPYLRYVAIMDMRTRPEHAARNNLCLPVDDPYWDTWAPPCGWNCRCTLQSLSQRDVDQMGETLKFEPPAETMKSWVNKRTGEVLKIPMGIDPGWEHNPGKVNAEAAVNDALAQKAAAAPLDLVTQLVQERVQSDAFGRFLVNPQGTMPVMSIQPPIGAAMGTDANVALLSAETMIEQKRLFPDLTRADYLNLPALSANPTVAFNGATKTHLLLQMADGRWLYGTLAMKGQGTTPFVSMIQYLTDAAAQKLIRDQGGTLIVDRRAVG